MMCLALHAWQPWRDFVCDLLCCIVREWPVLEAVFLDVVVVRLEGGNGRPRAAMLASGGRLAK